MNATGDNRIKNTLSEPNKAPGKAKSRMNLQYHVRFVFRLFLLALAVFIYFFDRGQFEIFFSHFFEQFTFLHLIWLYLLVEMTVQSLPLPFMPTGCMKQFAFRYKPFSNSSNSAAAEAAQKLLQTYTHRQNVRAVVVLLVWIVANSFWWILYKTGIFSEAECFLGTVLYMVFDLICILWFCPFQLFFMDTRCCSNCRIFNYGQIFTVTPILMIDSFASLSLILPAVIIFLIWEWNLRHHPERFYEGTNASLNCSHCTERLCVSRNRFYRFFRIPLPGRKKPGQNKTRKAD